MIQADWNKIGKFLRETPPNAIGAVFKEYVEESVHSGWDGFSTRDVTGIRRMLVDLVTYHEASGKDWGFQGDKES